MSLELTFGNRGSDIFFLQIRAEHHFELKYFTLQENFLLILKIKTWHNHNFFHPWVHQILKLCLNEALKSANYLKLELFHLNRPALKFDMARSPHDHSVLNPFMANSLQTVFKICYAIILFSNPYTFESKVERSMRDHLENHVILCSAFRAVWCDIGTFSEEHII